MFWNFLFIGLCVATQQPLYTIVETIPQDVKLFAANHTFDTWMYLIESAQESIDIAMLYIRMSDGANYPDNYGWHGPDLLRALRAAHSQRNVTVRLVQSEPNDMFPDVDSAALLEEGVAQVRNISMKQLIGADGVLHTKLIVIDKTKAVYLGSANMDWASTSQVKELGVLIEHEETIVTDASKCFEQYWLAGDLPGRVPDNWNVKYHTLYNFETPYQTVLNGRDISVYLASSPPPFVAPDREGDADSIVKNIRAAEDYINIEVMDYLPTFLYQEHNTFWPVIDDALRAQAFNNQTKVRLLIGCWKHSSPMMWQWLDSLNAVENIEVRLFVVPPLSNITIPFTRVNHAKFMVTEKAAFIDTSNWSADYFTNTGGLSFTFRGGSAQGDLAQIFFRDWDSVYTQPLAGRC